VDETMVETPGHPAGRLAHVYAAAVDSGDVEGFLAAFHADAVLEVFRPGDGDVPSTRRVGHAELAGVVPALRRYASTRHVIIDVTVGATDADGVTADGTVRCEAHHVTVAEHGAFDDVMTITYRDRYDATDGMWRIRHRTVGIEHIDRVELDTPHPESVR
jgi:ketosteroid isomerase-like protein